MRLLLTLALLPAPLFADSSLLQIASTGSSIGEDYTIETTVVFKDESPTIASTHLLYQRYTKAGETLGDALQVELNRAPSPTTKVFSFKPESLELVEQIAYWPVAVIADGNGREFSKSILRLGDIRRLRETVQGQQSNIQVLTEQLRDLEVRASKPPKTVNLDDVHPLNGHVAARFSTDTEAKLSVELQVLIDAQWRSYGAQDTPFARKHPVRFEGVPPDKQIRFIVNAKTGTAQQHLQTFESMAGSNLKSDSVRTIPVVASTDLQAESHEKLKLTLTLSEPGFVQVALGRRVPNTLKLDSATIKGRVADLGPLGRVNNPKEAKDTFSFSFDSLKESQEYGLQFLYIASAAGVQLRTLPEIRTVTTLERPKSLAFEGPIELNLSPIEGITVSWKATAEPKKAKLTLQYSTPLGPVDLATPEQVTTSTEITFSLPRGKFNELIAKQKDEKASEPLIIVEMWEEGEKDPVSLRLKIKNRLPQKAEIHNSSLQEPAKKGLIKVVEAYRAYEDGKPGKKVDWGSILTSGLAVFLGI